MMTVVVQFTVSCLSACHHSSCLLSFIMYENCVSVSRSFIIIHSLHQLAGTMQ